MSSRGLVVFAAVVALNAFTATVPYAQPKPIQPKPIQPKPIDGDVAAGRTLALQACTGCHLVASDQPYRPILKRTPRPPDFKDIANKPDVTAAWLRNYLASLPAIPTKSSQMANADLSEEEMRDVSAFIMTLRDKSPISSR